MAWPLLALLALQGGSTIRGFVRDSAGAPVRAAAVSFALTDSVAALSDSAGVFTIRGLGRGVHSLRVRHIAFHPSEFAIGFHADTTLNLEITLEARSLVLDTINVVDRSLDLYERKLRAVGFEERRRDAMRTATDATFLAPVDIERRHPSRLSQLLEGQRSVHVEYTGPLTAVARGRDGRCLMSVWVDGQIVFPSGSARAASSGLSGLVAGSGTSSNARAGGGMSINVVEPMAIAAIEIYPSPSGTPPQFQQLSGTCGAIVVWTKQ